MIGLGGEIQITKDMQISHAELKIKWQAFTKTFQMDSSQLGLP